MCSCYDAFLFIISNAMQTLRIVQNNILRTSTNRNLFNTECNKTSKQSYFIQCISNQNHFEKVFRTYKSITSKFLF